MTSFLLKTSTQDLSDSSFAIFTYDSCLQQAPAQSEDASLKSNVSTASEWFLGM